MCFISFCTFDCQNPSAFNAFILFTNFDTARLGQELLSDFFDYHGFSRAQWVQGAMIAIDRGRMRHEFDTFCGVDFFFQWLDSFYKFKRIINSLSIVPSYTSIESSEKARSHGSQFITISKYFFQWKLRFPKAATISLFWPLSSSPGHWYKLAIAHFNPWNLSFGMMYGAMLSDNEKSVKFVFEVRFFTLPITFLYSVYSLIYYMHT